MFCFVTHEKEETLCKLIKSYVMCVVKMHSNYDGVKIDLLNFGLEIFMLPRSGSPVDLDDDKIKVLIQSNWHLTMRRIAENLDISKSSVETI